MAAPAETRTPNLHRAKRFAPRECEWKHGDSGYSARRKPCRTKTQTNSLDSDRPSHGRRLHQHCAFRAANAAMAAALKRDSQLTRFRLPRKILIQLSMFVVSKPPSKHLLTHN